MRDHKRGTPAVLVIALLVTMGVATPAGTAEPMALEDVLRLLEAGISAHLVLIQVERTGTYLDPGVDDLIALRRAGADDALMMMLMDRHDASADVRTMEPAANGGVRIFVDTERSGGQAIVLTNLDENGLRLDGGPMTALRGVISSSDRSGSSPESSPEAMETAPAAPPATIEVTIRRDPEDQRLARLEERLRELESPESDRPPVGANFPRHPINDFREYPVLPFAYSLGFGYGIPVVAAQEFTVTRYGSFPSFTSAFAAGVNPFRPVQPCVHGQACSVHQRLANP